MVAILLTQHPARTTPTRLSSILDLSPRLRQVLGTPVELVLCSGDFSGSLLDDRRAPAAIRALVELARAFLHAHENPGSLTRARLRELAPLVDVLLRHNRPDDVEALWVYALSVFDSRSPLHGMITTAVGRPAREMYMTLRDELIARGQKLGEARGKKLGEAIGEARGRAIGKAQALLEVLDRREIPVPAVARKRILATRDELALQRWLERAITVSTVAELFEPSSRGRSGSRATVEPTAPPRAVRRSASPRAAS